MRYYVVTKISSPHVVEAAFCSGGCLLLMRTKAQAEEAIKSQISPDNQKDYCIDEVDVYSRDKRATVRIDAPRGVRIQVSSTDEEV